MKKYASLFLSLFIFVACAENIPANLVLSVDVDKPVIVELDGYTPIPLVAQADNPSTMVASPISKVERVDNKLIMMGMMSGSFQLIAYDMQSGQFISRIGNKGRAENEYSMINSFFINDKDNVFIYDRAARKYLEYNVVGEYVATHSAPQVPYDNIAKLGDGYILTLFNRDGADNPMLTYYNSDFTSSTPVGEQKQSYAMAQYKLLQDGEQVYAISPIERAIWRVNPDKSVDKVCEFDFGGYNMPSLESFASEDALLTAMSDKRYARGFMVNSLHDGLVVFRYNTSSPMLAWADMKSGKTQTLKVNCSDKIIYRGILDGDLIVITETEDNANLYIIENCTELK